MKYKLKTIPEHEVEAGPNRTYQSISEERELLSSLIKMLKGQKKALDEIIEEYLKTHNELNVMGVEYSMSDVKKVEYPFEETRDILSDFIDIGKEEITFAIADTNKKALEALIASIDKLNRGAGSRIFSELDKIAETTYSKRLTVRRPK